MYNYISVLCLTAVGSTSTANSDPYNISNWITLIFSVVIAAIISLFSLLHNVKSHSRDSIIHSITANRIEWIVQIRDLISEFLGAYIEHADINTLKKMKTRIELMIRNNHEQDYPMVRCLEACVKDASDGFTGDSEKLIHEVILSTQYSLYRAWVRIKIEGGQSSRKDSRVKELVDKTCGDFSNFSNNCERQKGENS